MELFVFTLQLMWHMTLCTIHTKNAKRMFSFNRSWCCIAENGHHIEKILKSAITIIARAEHFAYLIPKRIHSQFGILKYACHRKPCIFVMSHLFRRQRFELFMGTAIENDNDENHDWTRLMQEHWIWCVEASTARFAYIRISLLLKNVKSS